MFLGVMAQAQNLPPRDYSFKWQAVEGAGGYLAEVQNMSGNLVSSQQIAKDKTSVAFQLVPGPYQLRLTTLNRLLKPESATDWLPIHVDAASAPVISDIPQTLASPGTGINVSVGITGLAQDATASLTSPSGKKIEVTMSLPVDGMVQLSIPALSERGDYAIVFTNPPSLSTTANGKISVHYPKPVIDTLDPATIQLNGMAQSFHVVGKDFTPETLVNLQSPDGSSLPLVIDSHSPMAMTAVVPPNVAATTYQVMVTNATDELPVRAGVLTVKAASHFETVPPAIRYNIYRSTSLGTRGIKIGSSTTASYTDTSVRNGTTYYYEVTTANAGGESVVSSQISATPQVPVPGTPAGPLATAGNGQVALDWTAVSGATGYNIYRSLTVGAQGIKIWSSTSASYIDTSVTNGIMYYYEVTAVNAGGESGTSNQVSATPQVPAPISPPTGFTVTARNGQVVLNWTAISDETDDSTTKLDTEKEKTEIEQAQEQQEQKLKSLLAERKAAEDGLSQCDTRVAMGSIILALGIVGDIVGIVEGTNGDNNGLAQIGIVGIGWTAIGVSLLCLPPHRNTFQETIKSLDDQITELNSEVNGNSHN